jgi:hypothetical protein
LATIPNNKPLPPSSTPPKSKSKPKPKPKPKPPPPLHPSARPADPFLPRRAPDSYLRAPLEVFPALMRRGPDH